MYSRLKLIGLAVVALTALAGAVPALAHRAVEPRVPEVSVVSSRLLVLDSETSELVVLDDGREVERLSTPPSPLSLATNRDGRWAFVLRGRDTDRDHVTIVDTAFEQRTGTARRPYVARTFHGLGPGGVSKGTLPEIEGRVGVAMEGTGELLLLDAEGLGGLGDPRPRALRLAAPDHYAIVATRGLLYVGHLAAASVQVLDPADGRQVALVPGCPVLHGAAVDEEAGVVYFGCQRHVLAVATSGEHANQVVDRIPYPEGTRIAVFTRGRDGVLWGTTEGAPDVVLRLDGRAEQRGIEAVPLATGKAERTLVRIAEGPSGELIVLTHQGRLQIRDGATGALLKERRVSRPFDPHLHEHTDRAVMPDIVAGARQVHVSLPHQGEVVTVDGHTGDVIRRVKLGGEPTRLAVLERRST